MASHTLRRTIAKRKPKPRPAAQESVPECRLFHLGDPDSSNVALHLMRAGALVALLDEIACEEVRFEYTKIGASLGLDRDALTHDVRDVATLEAGRELARAREALHDLFARLKTELVCQLPHPRKPAAKAVA